MSGDAEAIEEIAAAVARGDRRAMARTITWLESTRGDRTERGQAILDRLVSKTGGAIRVGITGPPGVGKSTFIEAMGLSLIEEGHRVAVLAVDPSSPVTGGSILGDKTRMERLAQHPDAFIRPSPSGGSLGGVAQRTREAMLVCEASGYDVILIETVGIGQSEVTVASMVDFFLVLLLPAGGDELQGIKRGVMELADALVVNKADGDTRLAAERTCAEYGSALELIRPTSPAWKPRSWLASALNGEGIGDIREAIFSHRRALSASGEFEPRRREQARAWMWSLLEEEIQKAFRQDPAVGEALPGIEAEVASLQRTPGSAVRTLMATFRRAR